VYRDRPVPSSILSIAGLCLQVLGAFFLAKSVIWKAPRHFMRELLGFPAERFKTFRHYLAGRVEAIVGFVLFGAGAALQVAGLVREAAPGEVPGLLLWLGVTVVSLAGAAYGLYIVVKRVSRRVFLDTFGDQVRRRNWPFQEDPELLRELGELLEIPRGPEETVDTYQARIRERLGLPPRRPGNRRRRDMGGRGEFRDDDA
jgi:hypothetical protein